MNEPKNGYVEITSEVERLTILKSIGFTEKSSKKTMYKGFYCDEDTVCKVVGFTKYEDKQGISDLVIRINGELHTIKKDYLKDMQSKQFHTEDRKQSDQVLRKSRLLQNLDGTKLSRFLDLKE